jgi:hypothetical protein
VTARYAYVDACAFMRNAMGEVDEVGGRHALGRVRFRQYLDDADTILATSEIAVVEFYDAIGGTTRGPSTAHDDAWRDRSISEFMEMIASERVAVVPVPPNAIESALVLMTIAHAGPRVAFKALDAVHLVTACAWANSIGTRVDFLTCDSDFTRFFARFPYFGQLVNVVMVTEP